MRPWLWLKSWWTGAGISRQLSSIDFELQKLTKEKRSLKKRITETKKWYGELERAFDEVAVEARETLQEANHLVTRYEEQLEAARSKIRILEDTTIPTLVASNKVFLERWDAEAAIEVRKRVGASIKSE